MSSNKGDAMIRNLLLLGLAVCATACSTNSGRVATTQSGPTPTQNYSIALTNSPDEILLAVHADGLSARQVAALETLVGRWREDGGHPITIKAPAGDSHDAFRTVAAIQDRLQALGVAPSLIHQAAYAPAQQAGAPVVVGFLRYEAEGPKCGRDWQDFTHTAQNTVNSNFGCAVTANFAAMIANPADLAEPRATDDADASRRENVLGKYRQGQITSAAKDDQATGAVSNVVH
ncbi:MAG TPA: CpaD family pilus assembly protein [Caulobacteraceae bacterium]|jgi:pilus assembly protein CpaD